MAKGYKKVPVVMQMEALECGAACLCMVLAYHGKWLPPEELRRDCGVSRDGSSAKNILIAARSHGLNARGFRYEPEQLRKSNIFPCIIHWNFNHFVVLDEFKKDRAVLNDPSRGVIEVPMSEFDTAFTGIVLQFEPTETFESGGSPKSIFGFVKKRLHGAAVPLTFALLTSVIATLMEILSPAFSRIFLDRLLTGQNPDWLMPFLIALAFFTAMQLTIQFIEHTYSLKIEGKLAIVANSSFLWHVLCLPMEFFSQRMAGDISRRQSSNEGIASTLISQIVPVFLDFIMLIFYLTVMLRYSLLLSVIGLSSLLINLLVARLISKKRINISRVQMRDAGKLSSATLTGVEMIETIKASGAENGYFQRWAGYQSSANAQSVKFAKLNQYLGSIPGVVNSATNLAILMIGALLIMQDQFCCDIIDL